MGDICPTFILYFESRLEWQFKEMPFFALPYLLYLFFYVATLSQQQHKARNRKMGATANLPLSENRKICPQSPLNHLLSPLIKLCLFNLYNKYTRCCFIIQAHF